MAEEFERLHAAERDTGGQEVHVEPGARRLSNIFNKSTAFDPLLAIGPALAAAHYLLGEIKVHGANIRDPVKGYGQQELHVDVPKKFADDWWVVNAMILFDDMTLDNGPTRVIPGSHRWAPINVPVRQPGRLGAGAAVTGGPGARAEGSRCALSGRGAGHGAGRRRGDPATPPAGTAARARTSDAPRRLIHLSYTRRDLPQQLVQLDHLDAGPLRAHEPGPPLPARDRAAAKTATASSAMPKRAHKGWWN